MKIQHNLSAENTQRKKNTTSAKVSKNIGRLSTGHRINSAADDAAGLAISEKMRGQIRGLNRAALNVQDGASMIQTADGALQEIQNLLQRMRELAVQSASDTNANEVDREALDLEYQHMKSEINDIASTTSFNTRKLIDGTLTAYDESYTSTSIIGYKDTQVMKKTKDPSAAPTPEQAILYGSPSYEISTTFKDEGINGTSSITFTNNNDNSITIAFSIPNKTFSNGGNSATIKIPDDVSGNSFTATVTSDDGIDYSITVGCSKANFTADDIDWHFNSIAVENSTTRTPVYETINGVRHVSMILQTGANQGDELEISVDRMAADSIGGYYTYVERIMTDPGKPPTYKTIYSAPPEYEKRAATTISASTTSYTDSQSLPASNYHPQRQLIQGYTAAGAYVSYYAPPIQSSSVSYTRSYSALTYGEDVGVAYERTYVDEAYTIPAISDGSWTDTQTFPLYDQKPTIVETEFGSVVTGATVAFEAGEYPKTYSWTGIPAQNVASSGGKLTYEIRERTDTYTITKNDGSTENVGVKRYELFIDGSRNSYFDTLTKAAETSSVMTDPGKPAEYKEVNNMMYLYVQDTDIATQNSASNSIEVCSGAIEDVSKQRSYLGAMQNRLQFKYDNLGVSSENLSVAESTIRDADMAKEMTELTKNQVMSQAATTMLAQANALPQAVLQLLS